MDPDSGEIVEQNMATRIWSVFEDPGSGLLAQRMAVFMIVVIIISCVGDILSTVPSMREIPSNPLTCEKPFTIECGDCRGESLEVYDVYTTVPSLTQSSLNGTHCEVCYGTVPDPSTGEYPSFQSCEPIEMAVYGMIEAICIIIFTLDYLVRVCSIVWVPTHKWQGPQDAGVGSKLYHYCTQLLNVVDLIAILPFWVELLFFEGQTLEFVRVLRLARVFRIFKLGKYNAGMTLFKNTLVSSLPALTLLMFFISIGVILFGSIIYFVESGEYQINAQVCPVESDYACHVIPNHYKGGKLEVSKFQSIPFAFYWVMVTMTTVGYGDLYPLTGAGKFVSIICMLCGILCLALPITVLGASFNSEYKKMHLNDQDKRGMDEDGNPLDEGGGGEGFIGDEEGEAAAADKLQASEDAFWDKFSKMVVANTAKNRINGSAEGRGGSGGGVAVIDGPQTRERLKTMLLDGILDGETLPEEDETKGRTGGGGGSRAVYDLEATILRLQSTVNDLKAAAAANGSGNGGGEVGSSF
jgi:hypothetical protein